MAVDISELQAIDFALGAFVLSAFVGMAANGPDNYVRFLSRPAKEKIYRVDHDDAKALLDKIAADKKGDGSTVTPSAENRPDLPVIGYYRKPGISNGDLISVSGMGRIRYSDDLLTALGVMTMPISLDYSMTFAAWDKPTLDKMCLAWYVRMAAYRRARFIYPVKIADEILEVPVALSDNKTVMFSDASMPTSEQRLLAVTTALTLVTQAVAGEAITPIDSIEVHGITENYISRSFEVERG